MRLSVYGAVNGLSYGWVTINVTNSLMKLGHDVELHSINEHSIECEPQYQDNIKKALLHGKLFNRDSPCLKIWHQWQHSVFPANILRIGWAIFELDQLTSLERHNLNSLDGLFVCSEWAKKVCENNAIKVPIFVTPLGVDLDIWKPPTNPPKNNKTIFLNIGKFEKRKGHQILPLAFERAFSKNDKVELWMMPSNPFLSPEINTSWENLYKNSKLSEKIRFLQRQQTQNQVLYIIGQSHFGVYPTLAEGWCLPALESMAVGVPTIITNVSGQTEFVNQENSLLIEGKNLEPASDGQWFFPENMVNSGSWLKWEEEQMEQLVSHLREAHKMNMEQSTKLFDMREACLQTAQKFTWKNTAEKIIQYLT